MSKRIRIATVGTGYFSRFHYDAWQRMADVDIVAVCDRKQELANAVASELAIPAVFKDVGTMLGAIEPDLIDIITPPPTHLAMIAEAAQRGVPAICQKPFCQSLEEAEEAVGLAENAGVPLIVHENFRFQPWHRQCARMIREGLIGEPYQVAFRLRPGDGEGADAYLDRQPYFQTMERFLVHETAIHFIDTFRFLFGEVSHVCADLRRLNPVIAGEDAGVILFTFESGARGLFDGNRLADHPAENRRLTMGDMMIEGSDGALRLDGDGRLFLRPRGANADKAVDYAWTREGFGGDCVYALQRHIVDHLFGGGPIENTARDYLQNLRIETAVYDSNASGRAVQL